MSYQEQQYSNRYNSSKTEDYLYQNMSMDHSSTFVKPQHDGSSQSPRVYTHSTGTAIPPPPPYLYPQSVPHPKRNRGYLIAITILVLMVLGLGSLEVYQFAEGKLLTTSPSGSTRANQSAITTPVRTLTPGIMKENLLLTCGVCDDPILTTINTITIDTTNLRMVWVVKLNNHSGTEQIDNFNDFSLQDPNGNIYEGTGDLNKVFILSAGQIVLETEIFSFLPRPDVSYTLSARLGGAGITYAPVQFTF